MHNSKGIGSKLRMQNKPDKDFELKDEQ